MIVIMLITVIQKLWQVFSIYSSTLSSSQDILMITFFHWQLLCSVIWLEISAGGLIPFLAENIVLGRDLFLSNIHLLTATKGEKREKLTYCYIRFQLYSGTYLYMF